MPRHAIPVVLLARLAVSEDAQGQGIGRELVRHAALLTLKVAGLVGVRALVVDAVDEPTADFYEHVGFTPNDANPLRLEILTKDIDALIGNETQP
jgi:predicted N-acetyltransferase YhbS